MESPRLICNNRGSQANGEPARLLGPSSTIYLCTGVDSYIQDDRPLLNFEKIPLIGGAYFTTFIARFSLKTLRKSKVGIQLCM